MIAPVSVEAGGCLPESEASSRTVSTREGSCKFPNCKERWWAVTGSNCGPPACKTGLCGHVFDFLSGATRVKTLSTAYSAFIAHNFHQRPTANWEAGEIAGVKA
jgi:hypothetical protein